MNRSDLVLATIAAIVVAGCASIATQSAEQQSDKTLVTGSRLPARDGGTADVKSTSNKNDISDMMERGNSNNLPSMGGGK